MNCPSKISLLSLWLRGQLCRKPAEVLFCLSPSKFPFFCPPFPTTPDGSGWQHGDCHLECARLKVYWQRWLRACCFAAHTFYTTTSSALATTSLSGHVSKPEFCVNTLNLPKQILSSWAKTYHIQRALGSYYMPYTLLWMLFAYWLI